MLPRDAREQLGIDPDELEIATAVRMSMSIPMFFDPVVHRNPTNRDDEHVIVDGGLLSNFPIWLFDSPPGAGGSAVADIRDVARGSQSA